LATARKTIVQQPVTTYVDQTTIQLTLTPEEAQELRIVVSDLSVDPDDFPLVAEIRNALSSVGVGIQFNKVKGLLTRIKS
jgi:hypothetical protein